MKTTQIIEKYLTESKSNVNLNDMMNFLNNNLDIIIKEKLIIKVNGLYNDTVIGYFKKKYNIFLQDNGDYFIIPDKPPVKIKKGRIDDIRKVVENYLNN